MGTALATGHRLFYERDGVTEADWILEFDCGCH